MDDIEVFSLDKMPQLQADQTSRHARAMTERFTTFAANDADAREMQAILEGWDAHLDVESAAAAVYSEACHQLSDLTAQRYYDAVPGIAKLAVAEGRRIIAEQIAQDSPLMLGDFASWDAAIEAALAAAARALRERHGDDASAWRWGDDHRMGWNHNLGRDAELADLVNLPPVEVGGDVNTVFNTSLAYGASAASGVSFRQIYDLRDLNAARICIPPGNSGQPGSPHYGDNIERWRNVEYHPLYIDWDDIGANAEATLTLTPE